MRSLLRDALHEFDTVEADSGEAALAALEAHMPDLVVTDIHMSGMDGVELLGKVKEQYPELPVLGISGVVDTDEMREHAFDGFLEKPLEVGKLRELVAELIEGP